MNLPPSERSTKKCSLSESKRWKKSWPKDKMILHQKQMIICLKSGCVGVPNSKFEGPTQDCIPCKRLIRSDAPKEADKRPPSSDPGPETAGGKPPKKEHGKTCRRVLVKWGREQTPPKT